MMRVLKWTVHIDDEPHPIGSGPVVLVDHQNGRLAVWTIEDDDELGSARSVRVFGTGHFIPQGWHHVGSCIVGVFVWHVFSPVEAR
jgi:hypothetical protein